MRRTRDVKVRGEVPYPHKKVEDVCVCVYVCSLGCCCVPMSVSVCVCLSLALSLSLSLSLSVRVCVCVNGGEEGGQLTYFCTHTYITLTKF